MKIATFNINGINQRLPSLLAWLAASQPDVACLQELKAEQGAFPARGYRGRRAMTRSGGGSATGMVSRSSRGACQAGADPARALPGDAADDQARYLEAAVNGVLIAALYLPNGNPPPGPKFAYKLAWFERLLRPCRRPAGFTGAPIVLAGDYNVVPTDEVMDVYSPKSWQKKRPVPARAARGLSPAGGSRAGRTALRELHSRISRSTPSGTISATTGRGMPDCASITCCC